MRLIHRRVGALLVFACAAALLAPSFHAAQQMPVDYAGMFEKREAMIPTRDGVKLLAEIYSSRNAEVARPILMVRTPYGISSPDKGMSDIIYGYADMVPEGYIFVFEAI